MKTIIAVQHIEPCKYQILFLQKESDYEQALQKITVLEKSNQEANAKIISLEKQIIKLTEQLQLMKDWRFGKKSEKQVGELETKNTKDNELQAVSSYARKKGNKSRGRIVNLDNLPRHKIYHDLLKDQKICGCCNNQLEIIGHDISEQLEIIPARIYVAEHIRYKYACRCCNIVQMSPKPMSPIPKALAGGSLITEIIINKYQYHLPLYRQSKILASSGVLIPDNTLANWNMQSGNSMKPLFEVLWEEIISTDYLQVDETSIKILEPEKNGYVWTYFAPHLGAGLVCFEVSLTRKGSVAETRLEKFKGILQTDEYSGYNGLRKKKCITGCGCWAHCHRKFVEVIKITKNYNGIAAQVLERLKPVYALEKKMRQMNLSFHTRKRLRQKIAWPILKELRTWLKQSVAKIPGNSKLMDAVQYLLKHWKYLTIYLRHGKVEIDNNLVENKIRSIALGRKNSLFIGNEDSGLIHSIWYSLILSALINSLDPKIYIHYLLTQIHAIRKKTVDLISLLPHKINRTILKNFADQQLASSKIIINSS